MRYRPALSCLAALAFLLGFAAYAAEPATPAPAPVAPGDGTRMIADFRTSLPNTFSAGSWQGKVATTSSGCVVQGNKGADGKGELGETMQPLLDFSAVKFVEVALGTGPKNEVPAITLALNDVDGVQYTASIRVDQIVPGQPVWFRVRLADFKLNDWKGDKTGKVINWAKISQWHVQGDWKTEAPCHVMFIALRTRQ